MIFESTDVAPWRSLLLTVYVRLRAMYMPPSSFTAACQRVVGVCKPRELSTELYLLDTNSSIVASIVDSLVFCCTVSSAVQAVRREFVFPSKFPGGDNREMDLLIKNHAEFY